MIPYWLIFIIPALFALAANPVARRNNDGTVRGGIDTLWACLFVSITFFIGVREEVGADWFTYIYHLELAQGKSYRQIFSSLEFSHWFLNKLMVDLGWGLLGVNLVYGVLFSVGLVAFARVQPRPWVALACAVPYLVIVVGMGYSRQAVAVGLTLIGLVAFRRGRIASYIFWVLLAASFHNTAMFVFAVTALAVEKKHRIIFLIGLLVAGGLLFTIFRETVMVYIYIYAIAMLKSSDGALVRLLMNALAAGLFIYYQRAFSLSPIERRLWTLVSLTSLAFIPVYFLTELSTILDRLALYLIPLQLVTAAHLPDAFGSSGRRNNGIIFFVLLYFFAAQLVWLLFATHSKYWVPYRMGVSTYVS